MQVSEKDGKITIVLDKNKVLTVSDTGKTKQVASSHGNQPTSIQVDGLPMSVGVNCFIKNTAYKKPTT